MKYVSILVLILCSCTFIDEHFTINQNINPPEGKFENPDSYLVDSSLQIHYRVTKVFPPLPPWYIDHAFNYEMTKLNTDDIWQVTHKVGEIYLIYSPKYQNRQCEHLLSHSRSPPAMRSTFSKVCMASDLFYLMISPTGIVKGWLLLANPQVILLKGERKKVMDTKLREGSGWPEEPLFEQIK